jgi:hypothetical protein
MGLQEAELKGMAKLSFEYAFIDDKAKVALQGLGKTTSAF